MSEFDRRSFQQLGLRRETFILGSEDKKTVLEWIDASPSEQLQHASGIYLSFAACVIVEPIEWLGLSQYKNTLPPNRSHAAPHLTQLILEQHLLVDAMVVTAPIMRIEQHGEQILDQLARLGKGRWDDGQRQRFVHEEKSFDPDLGAEAVLVQRR